MTPPLHQTQSLSQTLWPLHHPFYQKTPILNTVLCSSILMGTMIKSYHQSRNLLYLACYCCQGKEHYATDCPTDQAEITAKSHTKDKDEVKGSAKIKSLTQLLNNAIAEGEFKDKDELFNNFSFVNISDQQSVIMQLNNNGKLPQSWILLNNQSTVDEFSNPKLLKNIQTCKNSMQIHCNAGIACMNKIGDLPGYRTVWYHPTGITNIMFLFLIKQNCLSPMTVLTVTPSKLPPNTELLDFSSSPHVGSTILVPKQWHHQNNPPCLSIQ